MKLLKKQHSPFEDANPTQPFPKWGISMKGIKQFISRCGEEEKIGDFTTTQVCDKIMKPLTAVSILS
jgi:hypothetical protein